MLHDFIINTVSFHLILLNARVFIFQLVCHMIIIELCCCKTGTTIQYKTSTIH